MIEINSNKEQQLFAPEEISAMILRQMCETAVSLHLHLHLYFFIINQYLFLIGSLSWRENYSCYYYCSSLF